MRKIDRTLCVVLLAVCGSPVFAEEWKKNFTVPGKADLRVDVDDGEAIVRVWDRNQIAARILTEGWKIAPSEVRVTDHQAGDRVEIEVRVPRMHINFGHRSVRVELQVPRELRASIHSGDGRISVQDLKGDIHLSTSDGSIEADAMVTNQPGFVMLWGFGDCAPVLLSDPRHDVVALVHAGWRGAASGSPVLG